MRGRISVVVSPDTNELALSRLRESGFDPVIGANLRQIPEEPKEPGKTLARAVLTLVSHYVHANQDSNFPFVAVDFAERTMAQAFNEAFDAHR
jgi:hypothetical protein